MTGVRAPLSRYEEVALCKVGSVAGIRCNISMSGTSPARSDSMDWLGMVADASRPPALRLIDLFRQRPPHVSGAFLSA